MAYGEATGASYSLGERGKDGNYFLRVSGDYRSVEMYFLLADTMTPIESVKDKVNSYKQMFARFTLNEEKVRQRLIKKLKKQKKVDSFGKGGEDEKFSVPIEEQEILGVLEENG